MTLDVKFSDACHQAELEERRLKVENLYFFILPFPETQISLTDQCVCDDECCAAGCSTWATGNASMNACDNDTEKDPEL